MKSNNIFYQTLLFVIFFIIFQSESFLLSERPRSSFGGYKTRSSFPKNYTNPRINQPRSSFGGNRVTSPFRPSPRSQNVPQSVLPRSSFGNRTSSNIISKSNIIRKYGVPRRVITSNELRNLPKNVVVNHYGDFASGLMMGYLMGHTSWLWYLPFHPAFYYSQPQKVVKPDGTISYYPPTFDWSKFFMTWIIIGSIGFIFYQYFKNRRNNNSFANRDKRNLYKSSFS